MAMRCHFVMAAAIVSNARTEDKVDEALQRYLEVRQHVAIFDGLFENHFQSTLAARNARVYTDLTAKMSTLFVFDFEGAICLKNWDDLGQIIRKARVCKDEKIYKAMGDCLLRSNASGQGTDSNGTELTGNTNTFAQSSTQIYASLSTKSLLWSSSTTNGWQNTSDACFTLFYPWMTAFPCKSSSRLSRSHASAVR